MRTALRILLFRHPSDEDSLPFAEAIQRAIQGGREAGAYLASGDSLPIQCQIYESAPHETPAQVLASVDHVLIYVILDIQLLTQGGDALWDWLADTWSRVDASNGAHAQVVLPMEERLGVQFSELRPELQSFQIRAARDLGERANRPAMAALFVLHTCRELLTAGSQGAHMTLFISHAKLDGLPLARSLRHQIQGIPWLTKFYDADDIPQGSNWRQVLQQAAGSSLMVMLRTEHYDGRYWCQQEVTWADGHAVPAVLVDARVNLNHPGASLPFDRVPTVRIPDGNLLRILFLALREGLRHLLFLHRVEELKRTLLPPNAEVRAFSFAPGMSALLRVSKDLGNLATGPKYILYPDPPLRTGVLEAADSLVDRYAPGTILSTPNKLAALSAGVTP